MRIAGVDRTSLSNGSGLCFVIFTQGCENNCKGCHNPTTHAINGGVEVPPHILLKEIQEADGVTGVTFSGGEPLLQMKEVFDLAYKVRKMGLNTYLYTGYDFFPVTESFSSGDQVKWFNGELPFDMIVDGKYVQKLKDNTPAFRGSTNQNFYFKGVHYK